MTSGVYSTINYVKSLMNSFLLSSQCKHVFMGHDFGVCAPLLQCKHIFIGHDIGVCASKYFKSWIHSYFPCSANTFLWVVISHWIPDWLIRSSEYLVIDWIVDYTFVSGTNLSYQYTTEQNNGWSSGIAPHWWLEAAWLRLFCCIIF